ncbi:uncharacterized protein LOC144434299 [Glandiceps talaboti]
MAGKDGVKVMLILLMWICQILLATAQETEDEVSTVETEVKFTEINVWGLRLWQVVGIFLCGVVLCIIIACCICDVRIPRTMKEIEARYKKKKVIEKYADDMNALYVDDLPQPPQDAANVLAEGHHVSPKKTKKTSPNRKQTPKKSPIGKLFRLKRKAKKTSENEESLTVVHNPISSDPVLTSKPSLSVEPLGGHMTKPGQSSRQITLSNL